MRCETLRVGSTLPAILQRAVQATGHIVTADYIAHRL
jgi:hypothetical protein